MLRSLGLRLSFAHHFYVFPRQLIWNPCNRALVILGTMKNTLILIDYEPMVVGRDAVGMTVVRNLLMKLFFDTLIPSRYNHSSAYLHPAAAANPSLNVHIVHPFPGHQRSVTRSVKDDTI